MTDLPINLTDLPPSTPTRSRRPPPVFSPRAPIKNATFSRPRLTAAARNVILPTGCDLIIRGIGARKPHSDTVKLLQKAIDSITKDLPELADVPVVVKQFSSRGEWTSTAYIHLDSRSLPKPAPGSEGEPRTDLLLLWKDALAHYDQTWEVKWTPLTHGKDKRLWIRFGQLKDNPKDLNFQEKCRTHLLAWAKIRGYAVTNSYFNPGGVTLCLASPKDVDAIIAHGMIDKIPGIPISVQPARGRQVEIDNVFELAFTGLSDDYDKETLHEMLTDWLIDNFEEDGITTLAGTRSDDSETEMFIFHMTTWKATCEVLSETTHDRFKADFRTYETMQSPQLLHQLNTSGLGRKPGSLRKDLVQGASMVTEGIDKLRQEFNAYKETNTQLHQATQLQLTVTTSTLTALNSTVCEMENRIVNTQRAILFQSQELSLTRAITDLHSNIISLRVNVMLENNETRKLEMCKMLDSMVEEEKGLKAEMTKTNGDFLTVVQGASVGQLLPNCSSPLPQLSATIDDADEMRLAGLKRRRLNTALTSETMLVDKETDAQTVNKVSPVFLSTSNPLIAANVGIPDPLMTHITRPPPRRTCAFHGVLDTLRDLNVSNRSRNVHCRSQSTNSCLLLLLVFILCLAHVTHALPPPTSTLSIYALNANGLVQPVKQNSINTVITARNPQAFVVGETKTKSKLSNSLPYTEYDIYEESGEQDESHHPVKWGIIVGIRKDIQIAQRLDIVHRSLKGRVIALDLVLPTSDGRCYLHRFIGAYAPWNPGDAGVSRSFWADLTELCKSTPAAWTLAGDLNATVSSFERASGGTDARTQYLRFLADTDAQDLWVNYPDRSRRSDWTCRGHYSEGTIPEGNIIDRVATFRPTLVDSETSTADRYSDWIPFTDHRAVVARVTHAVPCASQDVNADSADNFVRQRSNKPCVKIPLKTEKDQYQTYADAVDDAIQANHLLTLPVTDDDTFLLLYKGLSSIFTTNAAKVFGKSKPYIRTKETITNTAIKSIVLEIRLVGGAIRFERSGRTAQISLKAMRFHSNALARSHLQNLLILLTNHRKSLHKQLFAERSKEIMARARLADRRKIALALKGNSTRRLAQNFDYIPLPLAVNDLDNPEKLICNPEGVKATTMEYFRRLYDHSRIPTLPKPWMETRSVVQVRTRVAKDPFVWPRKVSLADLRALLRRGNNRPSPGPDQWEKWTVKSLSDFALTRVLDLLNYQVLNSCFPGDIKDMWLTMFHKRNLRTDLHNWRGLMLSNLLANLPMAWLNFCLIRYSSQKLILPDTQVAAQPGVQTRDLISFLSGVKCWASRHKQTVYAIKRDQMKGFDYLSPEGFYDAVRAYGLPEEIIDLDRASQTLTRCFIRTAYGITNPITVSGVNKQGGPASPLKSVFTTSLGAYYLHDLLLEDEDALFVSSSSMERGDPHTKDAEAQLLVGMVEATDDTYIFSRSLSSLITKTLAMERFQYAYGWLTQWSKSRAYVLAGPKDHPRHAEFQSVSTAPGTDPLVITKHRVEIVADELEFLRTKVNDPKSRFDEIKAFVESFRFPTIVGRLPITLLRKIVSQNIVSRCRALISLQPIKQTDAETLDKIIIRKVHDALGFPFQPSSIIATLPVSHHGFGFPSIARINACLAVEGLMRDLNHHIHAYRTLAKITLADWMCEKSGCLYPLDGEGLRKDFSRLDQSVPSAWLTAHRVLKKLDLSLREIDQSYIAKGDVSLTHVVRSCSHSHPQIPDKINGTVLRTLRLKGIRRLVDAGKWVFDSCGKIVLRLVPTPSDKSWSAAARLNWEKLANAVHGQMSIDDVLPGPADLTIPREIRRDIAERLISSLANICEFTPSRYADASTWASDGSMIPSSAGLLDTKSVVGAATGTRTLAMKIPGRNISILHGELAGLITALVLSKRARNVRLLTDHLNTVRLVDDSRTGIDQVPRLRYMNGRSYYRWLLDLSDKSATQIDYTAGHATAATLEAHMNNEADFYATTTQKFIKELPAIPIPTFFMNDFTFHSRTDGYIESNVSSYVDARLSRHSVVEMGIGHSLRMSTWAHDKHPPSDYPYTRAVSAHSAAVQLYARSGQLATADILHTRGKLQDKSCRLGCADIESMRHLFVICPVYKQWRDEASDQITERTMLKLATMTIEVVIVDKLVMTAKSLFSDSLTVWPLHLTMYYLGQIPDLDVLIPPNHGMNSVTLMKLKTHLSLDWHTSCIRLAGRIFGDYQKRMAVLNNVPLKSLSPSSRTYISNHMQQRHL